MKKYLSIMVALMVTLFTFSSFAAFTPPDKPADGWYVLDQAHMLSDSNRMALNHKIETLNKNTKNEYAVVILSILDGVDIFDAAQKTFRAWGVGKAGLNNGVMLMISVGDRKTRIHTGKGDGGDLPDLLCKDILDNTLKPYLKRGDLYGGINATLDAMSSHMDSRANKVPLTDAGTSSTSPTPSNGCSIGHAEADMGFSLLFFVVMMGFVVWRILARRARHRFEMLRQAEEELEQERNRLRAVQTVPTPIVARKVALPPLPAINHHYQVPQRSAGLSTATKVGLGVAVGAAALALAEAERKREADARRRREDEEDLARRNREAQSYTPSYSYESTSYSSSDSSSSSDSGSSDFGSGFSGGDSGGGGADGSW